MSVPLISLRARNGGSAKSYLGLWTAAGVTDIRGKEPFSRRGGCEKERVIVLSGAGLLVRRAGRAGDTRTTNPRVVWNWIFCGGRKRSA